jgi:hypothetical protein
MSSPAPISVGAKGTRKDTQENKGLDGKNIFPTFGKQHDFDRFV